MWYYAIDDQQHGPVSIDELRRLITQGRLGDDDLVWQDGMNDWVSVASIPELTTVPPPAFAPKQMEGNPYAAMPMDLQDVGVHSRAAGKLMQLKIASGFLIVMAVITLLLSIPNAIVTLLAAPANAGAAKAAGVLLGRFLFFGIQFTLQILTILGGIALIRGKGIKLAWAGAIAAFIPLCGPCLGLSIPFAIWIVVLLLDSDVQAAFASLESQV